MKKLVAKILVVVCVGAVIGTTIVFRSNQPTFKDFEEYNDDFITVRDFILEYYFVENVAQPLIIDLNDKILSHADEKIENQEALLTAVNKLNEKDFSYVEVTNGYMIFWDDETGYYGVLWSLNPKSSVKSIVKSSRPNMKSRKLSSEWYEVGALDVI